MHRGVTKQKYLTASLTPKKGEMPKGAALQYAHSGIVDCCIVSFYFMSIY